MLWEFQYWLLWFPDCREKYSAWSLIFIVFFSCFLRLWLTLLDCATWGTWSHLHSETKLTLFYIPDWPWAGICLVTALLELCEMGSSFLLWFELCLSKSLPADSHPQSSAPSSFSYSYWCFSHWLLPQLYPEGEGKTWDKVSVLCVRVEVMREIEKQM